MSWPTRTDYRSLLQHPKYFFTDAELQGISLETMAMGAFNGPRIASGRNASVCFGTTGAKQYAIRLFVANVADRHDRYDAISRHLNHVASLLFVEFEYQEKGARFGKKQELPLVKMERVQGDLLHDYVGNLVHHQDTSALRQLADEWQALMETLVTLQIAHGDLQHENVFVDNGKFKLIDYDGMFVPALRGKESIELGLPPYQHPERLASDYSQELDRFSGMVILITLRALAEKPALWQQFHKDDHLLFKPTDFMSARNRQQSSLFLALEQLHDADVREWSAFLRDWCTQPHYPALELPVDKRRNTLKEFTFLVVANKHEEAVDLWETSNLENYPPASSLRSQYERLKQMTMIARHNRQVVIDFHALLKTHDWRQIVTYWKQENLGRLPEVQVLKASYEEAVKHVELEDFQNLLHAQSWQAAVDLWNKKLNAFPPAQVFQVRYAEAKKHLALAEVAVLLKAQKYREAVAKWRRQGLDSFPAAQAIKGKYDEAAKYIAQEDALVKFIRMFNQSAEEQAMAARVWENADLDSFSPAHRHQRMYQRSKELLDRMEALQRVIRAHARGDHITVVTEWEHWNLDAYLPARKHRKKYEFCKGKSGQTK